MYKKSFTTCTKRFHFIVFFILLFPCLYPNHSRAEFCDSVRFELKDDQIAWEQHKNTLALLCNDVSVTLKQLHALFGLKNEKAIEIHVYNEASYVIETAAPYWIEAIFADGIIYISSEKIKKNDLQFRMHLKHEVFHAYLFQITTEPIPAWLEEGLAELISGEDTNSTIRISSDVSLSQLHVEFHKLPKDKIRDAYDYALLAVKFLIADHGFKKMGVYLNKIKNGYSSEEAFTDTFRLTESELETSIKTSSLVKSKFPSKASVNSLLSNGRKSPTPSPIPK